MDKILQIKKFSSITKVSRETIRSLKIFEETLKNSNKNLNLIGNSTINDIWNRHFLDSAQVIDFIDKNDKIIIDMGSGAGFPGIIIAILAKDRKIPLKIKLIEKSPKKIKFLKEVIKKLKLNLNVKAEKINFFESDKKFDADVLVARAFKPLEKILELIHKRTENWKKILVFLGKTGKDHLVQASKSWNIKYKQRMSITSSDSFIIEINKLSKK